MYEGSYTVDFLQQCISFILGVTTYPMWYGTDLVNGFMLQLPSIPYDSQQSSGYSFIVDSVAGLIMSHGLVKVLFGIALRVSLRKRLLLLRTSFGRLLDLWPMLLQAFFLVQLSWC